MFSVFPRSPRTVVWFGLALHLTYLLAMFDTFFHSPIIQVDVHHEVQRMEEEEPLAERVVLLVGSPRIPLAEGEVMAPYLRSIVEERGAFGLSHTRVPTESRPGHVALIAGLWEDPSAVFKGWKHNPVSFDSVFNHSSTTFSFGSPDILPIFGAPPAAGKQEDDPLDMEKRVLMWMYTAEEEDFTSDATRLDYFSLSKLQSLLLRARTDPRLDKRLRARGTMFFLHLLGLDTTGHGYGPHSKVVDGIVKQVEMEINDFYKDERTAFLFTADHGMSNIGNHGDGHPDNTRTPWIAWGSGIRSPIPDPFSETHDKVSAPWQFTHLRRRDVDQVNLTALMAALTGTQWPGNSVGVVPTDVLQTRKGEGARLALGNALGILEQFRIKEELKSRHRLMFRPFPELSILSDKASNNASARVGTITHQIARGNHQVAESESKALAGLALRGIDYYDTFDQMRLKWIVTAGYVSFGLYTLVYIVEKYGTNKDRRSGITMASSPSLDTAILVVSSAMTALLAFERTPWYCLYAAFPLFYIRCLLQYVQHRYSTARQQAGGSGMYSIVMSLGQCGAAVGVLFYIATGYNLRSVWTYGFVLLAAYPFLARLRITTRDALIWVAVLLPCSFWATLSVEKEESALLLHLAHWLYLITGAVCTYSAWSRTRSTQSLPIWLPLTLPTMSSMGSLVTRAISSLQRREGLSLLRQSEAWVQLVISIGVMLAVGLKPGQNAFERILLLGFAFAPDFLLLSASWEPFFLYNFTAVLLCWMYIEYRSSRFTPAVKEKAKGSPPKMQGKREKKEGDNYRAITASDTYRGLIFLYLVHAGFFCTGNVASISSFYLAPVYRIVPVFQPTIMSALLMFKIIVPFILLSAAFVSICKVQRLPPFALIMLTLVLSEPICLYFFWRITTTGSWLEIGSSISHFAIASLLVAWNVFLYLIGEWIMSGSTFGAISL
ncbi:hypothetical protein QFC21_006840 [Naganishia friedmannii]|uniref:Uncharacterized protein n=1 Tax=Naganishia friedmannii TaxID=89922 RepID=A0ACC2V048_9TREE|nr:hypothetical protein QFC21_006840 [Naganishia friedmannii]